MDIKRKLRLPENGKAYAKERVVEKKSRKEGHDALISILAQKGAFVTLRLRDINETVYGKLKESDRFTITVLEPHMGSERQRIVFKHAILDMVFETNVG